MTPWTAATGLTIMGRGPATGFGDPFDSLDGGRWTVGDHQLGRSRLDPANAAVAGGALEWRHPAATLVDRVDVTP